MSNSFAVPPECITTHDDYKLFNNQMPAEDRRNGIRHTKSTSDDSGLIAVSSMSNSFAVPPECITAHDDYKFFYNQMSAEDRQKGIRHTKSNSDDSGLIAVSSMSNSFAMPPECITTHDDYKLFYNQMPAEDRQKGIRHTKSTSDDKGEYLAEAIHNIRFDDLELSDPYVFARIFVRAEYLAKAFANWNRRFCGLRLHLYAVRHGCYEYIALYYPPLEFLDLNTSMVTRRIFIYTSFSDGCYSKNNQGKMAAAEFWNILMSIVCCLEQKNYVGTSGYRMLESFVHGLNVFLASFDKSHYFNSLLACKSLKTEIERITHELQRILDACEADRPAD